MCTCKEEQIPSLTLAPGRKGSGPQATWSDQDPLPLSHLTQVPLPSSPCTLWPAFQGWCQLRAGELLHCVSSGKHWEREGTLTHPLPHPAVSPQPSPRGSLFLQMCFRGAHLKSPSASDSQADFRAQKLSQHPHTLEVRLTQESVSMSRGCRGMWGPGLGILPHVPVATGTTQKQKPFTKPLPHFPLKHKPTIKPTLEFQSIVKVLLFGTFLVISLYLGDGMGGLCMQGSAPVLSQRPTGPPTPSCSICVQRAKCPPLPTKKKAPAASENGRGCRKGGWDHPPLQSENPN